VWIDESAGNAASFNHDHFSPVFGLLGATTVLVCASGVTVVKPFRSVALLVAFVSLFGVLVTLVACALAFENSARPGHVTTVAYVTTLPFLMGVVALVRGLGEPQAQAPAQYRQLRTWLMIAFLVAAACFTSMALWTAFEHADLRTLNLFKE